MLKTKHRQVSGFESITFRDVEGKGNKFSVFCHFLSRAIKQMRHFIYCIHTPGNVGVSSKHVMFFSNYSNSVGLAITATVECTCSPAVRGGAVTQFPNV